MVTASKGILAVTPGASHRTAGQPHKSAGPASM